MTTARLRGLLGTMLVAGLLSTGVGAAPAAHAAGKCNDPFYGDIKTSHVSCAKGKKVAIAWNKKAHYGPDGVYVHKRVKVRGFTCVYRTRVNCTDGKKKVSFYPPF